MIIMGIPDTVIILNDSAGSHTSGDFVAQQACTLHVRMGKELHHLSPSLGQEADKSNDIMLTPHILVQQALLTSAAGGDTYDRVADARFDKDKKLGTDREKKAMDGIIFSVREVREEHHQTLEDIVHALQYAPCTGFSAPPILHPLGAWTRDSEYDVNNNDAFRANVPTLALFDIAYIHFDGVGHYNFLLPP